MTDADLPPAYPPRAQAGRIVAVLSLLAFFLTMDLMLTNILIEPMKRDMALSDVQIGLLQGTAFGLALGLSSIPLGRLIDRTRRMTLLIGGLALWIVAMASSGLAGSVWILVAARVALGVVAALLVPAALSVIADLYPPERRSVAASMFIVGQAGGQAFGILAGGLAFDALTRMVAAGDVSLWGLAPWRALYLAAASVGVVLLFLLAPLAEPARREQRAEAQRTTAALRELWTYRRFLLPLVAALLFGQIIAQTTSVWATPVLIRNHGLTPGQFAGWLSGVILAGGIIGAFAGGRLGEYGRRRGGRTGVLLAAFLGAVISVPLSFFAMAGSVTVFAVMLGLMIFAGAVMATLGAISITLNIPNEVRGLALGVNAFTTAVFGMATAPILVALVAGELGGESKLGVAIASLCVPSALLSAFFFLLAMRTSGKEPLSQ